MSDRIVRSVQTVESYTRALQYDASNAELWWQRGRLYHYTVEDTDIDQAISDYRTALRLNPRLGMAWVDLSDALEHTGQFDEAADALDRAFEMQPYSPLIRWQAGNFFLRRADLPRMYECFKTACSYDKSKLGIAIETAWKIDPDRETILQKLIPDDFRANIRYLNFLVEKNELDLAMEAWRRCMNNPVSADFQLKPSYLFGFIDHLLKNNRTTDALKVWDDILRKALTGLSDSRFKDQGSSNDLTELTELMWNGSFENEILRGGFDWNYPNTSEARFRIDTKNRLKGLKSFEITFEKANVARNLLYQIVPIFKPGAYILEFYVQSNGLTTDKMPYISIVGYPNANGLYARSTDCLSENEWIKLSVPFNVSADCTAVRISLRRDKSTKLGNKIQGSLWLDGFSIRPSQATAGLRY